MFAFVADARFELFVTLRWSMFSFADVYCVDLSADNFLKLLRTAFSCASSHYLHRLGLG